MDKHGLWAFEEDKPQRSITVMRTNGFAPDSEGPTLYSREEVDEFIHELWLAARRVFPPSYRDEGR